MMITNPISWPKGARCAVMCTWDMDADSILHLAHPRDADTRLSTKALVGFQGRGCAETVQPYSCHPFLIEAFIFQWP
jgi:hypothetical protein